MFQQLLTPVADSLGLSVIAASLPILTVLVLLGLLRRPAWQASLAGLVVGFVIAVGLWRCRSDWRSTPRSTASSSRCGR